MLSEHHGPERGWHGANTTKVVRTAHNGWWLSRWEMVPDPQQPAGFAFRDAGTGQAVVSQQRAGFGQGDARQPPRAAAAPAAAAAGSCGNSLCGGGESCCEDAPGCQGDCSECCVVQATYCVAPRPSFAASTCCPRWTVACSVGSVGCCDPARPWQELGPAPPEGDAGAGAAASAP
eukprot:gene4145-8110_t